MAPRPRFVTPYLNGRSVRRGRRPGDLTRAPFDGTPLARVVPGTGRELDEAIGHATAAYQVMRAMPRFQRHTILREAAARIGAEREALAQLMCQDAGKPITLARGEVDRAILTFQWAAEEARRFGTDSIPADVEPRAEGMMSLIERFPIGPIAAIAPFNFPLNLIVHKLAPAIATGNPVILKPAPQAPLAAFRLAEILTLSGLPAGGFQVLHLPLPVAERLATDPRFAMLSFTGSAAVGWHLKSVAGRKRVTLELGGNAAAVVHSDAEDLDRIAARVAWGAFAFAGQVCIKVQRLLVHAPIYQRFVQKVVAATKALKVGDPRDPKTVVGPMIDAGAVIRVQTWVREALDGGARPLLLGRRRGQVLYPTILADVSPKMKVSCLEVFGPVLVVEPYGTWTQALGRVNHSEFGLHAGIFTADIRRVFEAYRGLDVGGVIANDIPTVRLDHLPYGGIKSSGFGREGIRNAMEEMSEPRILIVNLK